MTGLQMLGVFVFLVLCVCAYLGAKMFYAAMDEAEAKREAEDDAVIAAVQSDLQRRQLRDQNARALESDSLLRAIAEYEANELKRR